MAAEDVGVEIGGATMEAGLLRRCETASAQLGSGGDAGECPGSMVVVRGARAVVWQQLAAAEEAGRCGLLLVVRPCAVPGAGGARRWGGAGLEAMLQAAAEGSEGGGPAASGGVAVLSDAVWLQARALAHMEAAEAGPFRQSLPVRTAGGSAATLPVRSPAAPPGEAQRAAWLLPSFAHLQLARAECAVAPLLQWLAVAAAQLIREGGDDTAASVASSRPADEGVASACCCVMC